MKRPAIFFDRDNTLIVSDGYLGEPSKVVLVDGAADAVARARELGYATVVFSNQSGVARGYYDEQAVRAVNEKMAQLLAAQNPRAIIDRHEFCPFHPEGTVQQYRKESDLRKPRPGMILKAARELDLDLKQSWVIGDAPRDVEAGAAAGCRTVLVQDAKLVPSPAADAKTKACPDHAVPTLRHAMDIIAHENQPQAVQAGTAPASDKSPTERLESLTEQILHELRRSNDVSPSDFSASKLLAGIVQIIVLAVLFFAYLYHEQPSLQPLLLLAIALQTLTIALLIMGKQG